LKNAFAILRRRFQLNHFFNGTQSEPVLSVVITIGARRWRAVRCLKAILTQVNAPRMQIVVMDNKPHLELPQFEGSDWERIQHVPCSEIASIPEAKARGASLAVAPVVAFLEDHCVPEPGWAEAVALAFEQHPDLTAVAYSFGNLNPVNWVSRSFLILAYGPWVNPLQSGPVSTPSWMNLAYKRDKLPGEAALKRQLSCEGRFLSQLQQSGAKFWQSAEARVKHLNHPSLIGSALDSAVWQRLMAANRADLEEWSWPRRLLYFFAAVPLSPSIIAWRLSRRLWARPEMRLPLLSSLPLVLFVFTIGSFWEAIGYVAGPGDPASTFWIETGDPRGEAL
jgi:hypothetical protein